MTLHEMKTICLSALGMSPTKMPTLRRNGNQQQQKGKQ